MAIGIYFVGFRKFCAAKISQRPLSNDICEYLSFFFALKLILNNNANHAHRSELPRARSSATTALRGERRKGAPRPQRPQNRQQENTKASPCLGEPTLARHQKQLIDLINEIMVEPSRRGSNRRSNRLAAGRCISWDEPRRGKIMTRIMIKSQAKRQQAQLLILGDGERPLTSAPMATRES